MKRIMTLALTLFLALSLCIPALAVGGFDGSPSYNDDPVVEEMEPSNPEWTGELELVSYKDRSDLSAEDKAEVEAAYAEIAANENLADLVPALEDVTDAPVENLAVSDLFYIDVKLVQSRTGGASGHGKVNFSLKVRGLDGFAALMNYKDGEWVIVEGAKVNESGRLQFSDDNLGTYAIVVNTKEGSDPTGDQFLLLSSGLCLAAAAVVGMLILKDRKRA